MIGGLKSQSSGPCLGQQELELLEMSGLLPFHLGTVVPTLDTWTAQRSQFWKF